MPNRSQDISDSMNRIATSKSVRNTVYVRHGSAKDSRRTSPNRTYVLQTRHPLQPVSTLCLFCSLWAEKTRHVTKARATLSHEFELCAKKRPVPSDRRIWLTMDVYDESKTAIYNLARNLDCRVAHSPWWMHAISVAGNRPYGDECLSSGSVFDDHFTRWCDRQSQHAPIRRTTTHSFWNDAGRWTFDFSGAKKPRFHSTSSSPSLLPKHRVLSRNDGKKTYYPGHQPL